MRDEGTLEEDLSSWEGGEGPNEIIQFCICITVDGTKPNFWPILEPLKKLIAHIILNKKFGLIGLKLLFEYD